MIDEKRAKEIEQQLKEVEQDDRSPLVIDKRVLLISFKSKIKWIAIITLSFMLLVSIIVSIKVKPLWKASCRVIRMQKNISTPTDMPYLYNSFDINTILETARSRPIILAIMDKLEMEGYKPEEVGRMIEVQRGYRSNVLNFSVTDTDVYRAVEMANVLGQTFIEKSTEMQNASADSVYSYYSSERDKSIAKISELEKNILAFQKEHDVISIDSERDQLYEKLKLVEVRKIETLIKIDEMRVKITDLEKKMAQLPQEVMMTWTFTNTDEKKLILLKKELELLLTRYTPINPKVQNLQAEIDTLEIKIASPDRLPEPPDNTSWGPNGLIQTYEVDKTRYEGELKAAKANLIGYQNEINAIKSNLIHFNAINDNHLELQRQLELSRDVLRIIEGRIAESRMALDTNTNDFQLFEPAVLPQYPVNISKKLIVLASGFLMGFILVVFYLGKELFDFRVKSKLDYDKYISIPLLGQIPSEEGANANKFYANLQYMLDNLFDVIKGVPKPPVITIGSAHPETGKSFLMNEFSKMLGSTSKVLVIQCVKDLSIEIEDYEINTYLDDDKSFEVKEISRNINKCYFWTGEQIFKKMYNTSDFHKLYGLFMEYDYILWEMFPSNYNIQLYHAVTKSADANLLVGRFKYSPKTDIFNLANYLHDKDVQNVYGILNDIPKEYYVETL